ncbi:hypothetical protein ACSFB8_00315 [Enterococcus faecalis]
MSATQKSKKALNLYEHTTLSVAEIAKKSDLSVSTVYNHVRTHTEQRKKSVVDNSQQKQKEARANAKLSTKQHFLS